MVKTQNGYRLFRAPIAALKNLRSEKTQGMTCGEIQLARPSETVFALHSDRDARIDICGVGFSYEAESRCIRTTSGKECTLCSEGDLEVRLIADCRSVEIYIQNEIAMSFFVKEKVLCIDCDYALPFTQYTLKSIWNTELS